MLAHVRRKLGRDSAYRIPKGLQNDNATGSSQVEAQCTGAQTTKQHSSATVVPELVETGFTVIIPHSTVVARKSNVGTFQEGLDFVEHRGEHREDNELVVRRFFMENLHQMADLG